MYGQTNIYWFESWFTHLKKLNYYPFIISLDRRDGSCDTVENRFGRICVFLIK